MTTQTRTKIHTVYKNDEGLRLPSVTTILGVLDKPALLSWAWEMGTKGLDYRKVRDDAASVGTLAHYLIMCHLKGETPDTSEYAPQDLDRAETCLIKYWDWEKANPIEPILIEEPLVSEIHSFGGTIDFLGKQNGNLLLIDHKTGKGIYPEMAYQLAAYKRLLAENTYNIDNARILRIGRDPSEGFEEKVFLNLEKEEAIFMHCLGIYRLQRKGG